MDREAAYKQVERNQEYMVDILRRIIAVDTTIPPGEGYEDMISILEPELAALGFSCERVEVPEEKVGTISSALTGPRANLVARLNNDRPPVSVYAHMDVVPVGDTPWTHDPFGGEIENGRLYGRGAVDMKGSIAAFLGAVKALKDLGIEPIFDLQALFCTDEEVGIQPGSRHLAEMGYFSPHIVWLEIAAVEPLVVTQTAGAARFEITGIGKSCHSGANYMGVNAIEEMVPVMNELLTLKKHVEQKESGTPALPLPGCPFRFMTPMFNLNIIRGGTKDNIVPGECTLTVNRRFIAEESFEDITAEIQAAVQRGLKRSSLVDLSFFPQLLYPPARIDPDTQAARRARAASRMVKGHQDFTFGGFSASTDLGFVLAALSPLPTEVAAFSLWRINEPVAHAPDEYVHLEDLLNMARELVLYFGDETLEKN